VLENNTTKNLQINNDIKNANKINTEPTTQIKNFTQELEKPKTNLNNDKITSQILSFDELVNLVEKKREIELKFDLERNVKLIKFSQGKIDIEFNEKLSKNFIKHLTSLLLEWTGKRWIITLSQEKGKKTIYEKKNELKIKLFEDAKKTEIYKRVKELFPQAELTDVKELNQKEE